MRELPDEHQTIRITRDPAAERDALNDYLSGLARGGDNDVDPSAPPADPSFGERHA